MRWMSRESSPGTSGRSLLVGRRLGAVADQLVGDVPVRERRGAGQEVIDGTAERVDVAPNARGPAVARLLGRNVIEGADGRPLAGDALVFVLSPEVESEVNDLDVSFERAEQIRGLDVAVDQPAARRKPE